MKSNRMVMIVLTGILLLGSLTACGGAAADVKPTSPPEPAKQELAAAAQTTAPAKVEAPTEAPAQTSKFPLPPNAKIIQSTDAMAIASVAMTIDEVMEFYRADAKAKGLTEYELLTTTTENTLSMAFRVPGQDEELVVQGTVISADNLTLSLRYEETDVK